MGGEDDGDARGPCCDDDARDGRPGEPVLADGGLVEDQHRRPVGDRAGEGEPAHLAAGEPVGVGAGQGCQPEDLQQRVGASPRGVLVEPEQAAGAEHVVAHRAGDDRELGLLRHPADPSCQLRGGPLPRRGPGAAGEPVRRRHRPARRGFHAGEQGGERGLPGAAGAHDRQHLPGADADVDAAERRHRRQRRAGGGQADGRPPHDPHRLGVDGEAGPVPLLGGVRGEGPGPATRAAPPGPRALSAPRGGRARRCRAPQTPCAASSAARAASVGTTGPSAATRPAPSRTTRRSTSPAHASSRCSTSTMVAPVRRTASVTDRRTAVAVEGSSIAEGSSSRTRCGPSASTPASARRCASPPESAPTGWWTSYGKRAAASAPGPSPRSGPAAARGSRGRTPRPARPARRPRRRPGPGRAGPRTRRRRRARARRP